MEKQNIQQNMQYGKQKQQNVLPQQRPVGEEDEPKKRSPFVRFLLTAAAVVSVVLMLTAAYLFLLVGEPDADSKKTEVVQQQTITSPMSPWNGIGDASLASVPSYFGDSVLYLYSGATLEKTSINDTAFGGGYARITVLTYQLQDGSTILAQSMRPTGAVTLLSEGGGYTLDGDRLYTLAGLNAARIDNGKQSVIFAETDKAVYALIFPTSKLQEVTRLLKATTLLKAE